MDYAKLEQSVKQYLAAQMKEHKRPKSIEETAEIFAGAIVYAIKLRDEENKQ